MSSSRKRKYHPRTSTDDAYTHASRSYAPETSTQHSAEPDPALFIVAYEADLVHGAQSAGAAQALEVEYRDPGKGCAHSEYGNVGSGLIKWERAGADTEGDVWVDRYDARLLLDSLPTSVLATSSSREPSPSGWSDLPSDAEDTFFFSQAEAEDYHREKRRRLINQLREERLKAMEDEDDHGSLQPAEERWGGSDEEPEETQKAVMRRTAAHVVASPNAAQLEMRILANHGADPRFAFLRGRWARAWALVKAEARRDAEKEKTASSGKNGLGGLIGYEDSDEESGAEKSENGEEETNETQEENKQNTLEAGDDDEAIKEARRARAKEWMKQRRARLDSTRESDGDGSP